MAPDRHHATVRIRVGSTRPARSGSINISHVFFYNLVGKDDVIGSLLPSLVQWLLLFVYDLKVLI